MVKEKRITNLDSS